MKKRQRTAALAGTIVAAFLLTACGGGTGMSLPPAASNASGGAPAGTKHKVKATIRITIPKRHRHRRVRIHGHYVSVATESIAIAIARSGGPVVNYNTNLTPASNPNCTQSLISPLICTVEINLQPGDYTASFATYDGLLSGGGGFSDPPTGEVLSANQSAAFDVVAGRANGINVTLDGVATAVEIVPAGNSSFRGNAATGYTISKCGTASPNGENVNVFGTDADDNLIIGPGAPATALASSNPTLIAVATPAPSAPNLYTISHPISMNSQGPATLTATVTTAADAGGGTQTATAQVTINGGNPLCGLITEFPVSNPNGQPAAIALGPDGNLWFTECPAEKIGRMTTAGVETDYSSGHASAPVGIVSGPSGALWFADSSNNVIGEMNTSGSLLNQFPTPGTPGSGPGALTEGSDGNIWYTRREPPGFVGVTTPAGVVTEYTIATGNAPGSIASGNDGNLWFIQGNSIGTSTTSGVLTNYTSAVISNSGTNVITQGADANLWFTDGSTDAIGKITTGGTITEFPALPTPGSFPGAITAGPDQAMWFLERGTNRIGRMLTDGTGFIEYSVPTANAGINSIVAGSDDDLWFTECAAGKIGRVQ
jgi:virginiamycin B lyase